MLPLPNRCQARLAKSTAAVLCLAAQSRHHQPSRWEKRLYVFLFSLAWFQHQVHAQNTAGALDNIKDTVLGIVQGLFIIGLAIGLIRTVFKFINQAPDAMTSLGYLIGGVVLWFGFQYFKDDLVTTLGGGAGGVE